MDKQTTKRTIRPDDVRLSWPGAISLQRTPSYVMQWRIPHRKRALFPPVALQERAAMSAGVRLTFRSNTTTILGELEPQPEATSIDLVIDGELYSSASLEGQESFSFPGLSSSEKLIELWLPQAGKFRLRSLALSPQASLSKAEDYRPLWVTYGSSISHCVRAASPVFTWPAIVARGHDLNLTCLGYGGNCHLEPMIARMIRDQPADFLSMKVGINVQGSNSLNVRTFRAAVIGFVQIVREKHPDIPFAVISPIYSGPREITPNAVGFSLRDMRDEVAAAIRALKSSGDRHLHYFDGLELFGEEAAHLLPDDLHPNAEGNHVLGTNFLRKVAAQIFVPPRASC